MRIHEVKREEHFPILNAGDIIILPNHNNLGFLIVNKHKNPFHELYYYDLLVFNNIFLESENQITKVPFDYIYYNFLSEQTLELKCKIF